MRCKRGQNFYEKELFVFIPYDSLHGVTEIKKEKEVNIVLAIAADGMTGVIYGPLPDLTKKNWVKGNVTYENKVHLGGVGLHNSGGTVVIDNGAVIR